MWKTVFYLLFTAAVFLVVSSEDDYKITKTNSRSEAQASASALWNSSSSSSSSSASSQSSASSSSSTVTETKISKRCKKNERWVECPSSLCVPATCDQLGKPIACPRIIPGRCPKKPACVCIEGYVRDKNGICIPKNQCQKCGKNQRFVECPDELCIPSDCVQLGRSLLCPIVIPGYCPRKPGCICIEGYVTNGNTTCIPKEQCPSCGDDPNAVAGCGFLCGNRCDRDKSTPPKPCPCEINGCQCRSGFTYDPIQDKCVRPSKCKNLCPKPNEVYDPCPLACPPRKCGIDDRAVLCQNKQPCLPAGCRCKDGTYRNDEGNCVLWEDCPPDYCDDDEPTEPPVTKPPVTKPPVTKPPGQCPDNLEQNLIEANAKLTGLFLYESMQSKPGENLVMSAFSLLTPFGQLGYFSQGTTQEQFLSVLNLSSKDYIRCVFAPLLRRLSAEQNVVLNLAVRIFTAAQYPLSQNFLDYTADVFDAKAENVDFNDGAAAAKRINEWAASATNNKINQIVTPDMFSALTRLVLANAMYFLGNWKNQFNPNNTEVRDFYVSENKPVKVPTMYQQNTFKYGYSSKLDAQLVELPYKGENVTFLVVLPSKVDGLPNLVKTLQEPKEFYDAYDSLTYQKVQVFLPKFEIESKYDLTDIMKKAGLTDVFDPSRSNLTGILKNFEPLIISSGVQKCYIKADEVGTEAAVVNALVVGTTSAIYPPPKIYIVDCKHPFAYFILYKNITIFSGLHLTPSPKSSD